MNKKRLEFYIDPGDWKYIQKIAKLEKVSGAEIIRRAIKALKDEREIPVSFHVKDKEKILRKLRKSNVLIREALSTGIKIRCKK